MQLPPCPARHSLAGNRELFFCAHPQLFIRDCAVTGPICTSCRLWQEPPPERMRPLPMVWPPKPRGQCSYLGQQTGLRECNTCAGSVRVKVFACGHPRHGETTLTECANCPDFQERGPGDAATLARAVTRAPAETPPALTLPKPVLAGRMA